MLLDLFFNEDKCRIKSEDSNIQKRSDEKYHSELTLYLESHFNTTYERSDHHTTGNITQTYNEVMK